VSAGKLCAKAGAVRSERRRSATKATIPLPFGGGRKDAGCNTVSDLKK